MCSSRQTRGGATLRGRVTPKQRKRGSDIRARTCTRLRLYCTCVSSRSFTEARRESASRTAPTKPLDRSVGGRRAVRSSCFAAGEADAAGRRNRCPAPAPDGRVRLLFPDSFPAPMASLARVVAHCGWASRRWAMGSLFSRERVYHRLVPSEIKVARVHRRSQRAAPVHRCLRAGKRPAATSYGVSAAVPVAGARHRDTCLRRATDNAADRPRNDPKDG